MKILRYIVFSYSLNQGRNWYHMSYDRYAANVTISGLATEPHSRSRMFSLWGHHSQVESNKTGWMTFTISFKDLLNKQCKSISLSVIFSFPWCKFSNSLIKNWVRFFNYLGNYSLVPTWLWVAKKKVIERIRKFKKVGLTADLLSFTIKNSPKGNFSFCAAVTRFNQSQRRIQDPVQHLQWSFLRK